MSSLNNAPVSKGWQKKGLFLFTLMPLIMLPFIFLYAFLAWWLLILLDGFPGGFFKRHPVLTVGVLYVFAAYLLILTGLSLWEKLRRRFPDS